MLAKRKLKNGKQTEQEKQAEREKDDKHQVVQANSQPDHYSCPECLKTYVLLDSLKSHQHTKHRQFASIEARKAALECPFCMRMFSSTTNRKMHQAGCIKNPDIQIWPEPTGTANGGTKRKLADIDSQLSGSYKEFTPYLSLTKEQAIRLPPVDTSDPILYLYRGETWYRHPKCIAKGGKIFAHLRKHHKKLHHLELHKSTSCVDAIGDARHAAGLNWLARCAEFGIENCGEAPMPTIW
jgi:hypothetical protein